MARVKCPQCGKEVDSKGLGGHLFGAHMIRVGLKNDNERLFKRIFDVEWRLSRIKGIIQSALNNPEPGIDYREILAEVEKMVNAALRPDLAELWNEYQNKLKLGPSLPEDLSEFLPKEITRSPKKEEKRAGRKAR